ncbi:MAG TPA: hypothetical protein VFF10_04810 [Trueperaceae bacterium]|nr:hypothetical protein [Trueperaceae bacterium]
MKPRRTRPPLKPHSAFASLMPPEEAQAYLPNITVDGSLVYLALTGYGWDRQPDGPTKNRQERHPAAIVTWDPSTEEVIAVTGIVHPISTDLHELVMAIERPLDLEHLVDLLRPYVDARDQRVYLA